VWFAITIHRNVKVSVLALAAVVEVVVDALSFLLEVADLILECFAQGRLLFGLGSGAVLTGSSGGVRAMFVH